MCVVSSVSTRAANKRCYSELYVIVLSDFFHTLRCNVRVVAEDGDISRCATSSSTQQLQTDSVVQRASVCLIRSTQTVRLSVDSIGGCFVLVVSNVSGGVALVGSSGVLYVLLPQEPIYRDIIS